MGFIDSQNISFSHGAAFEFKLSRKLLCYWGLRFYLKIGKLNSNKLKHDCKL